MTVYLFSQGANFALLVFGLTALAVIGLLSSVSSNFGYAKRRRSSGHQHFGRYRCIGSDCFGQPLLKVRHSTRPVLKQRSFSGRHT